MASADTSEDSGEIEQVDAPGKNKAASSGKLDLAMIRSLLK